MSIPHSTTTRLYSSTHVYIRPHTSIFVIGRLPTVLNNVPALTCCVWASHDLWNRWETVRTFSAQNVRKPICHKGFQAVCTRCVTQTLCATLKKQPKSPTYMGIYFYVMYSLFFKGFLTYARVTELQVTSVKICIYIYK